MPGWRLPISNRYQRYFQVSWKTMGFLDCVQVSVRMLPVRLARCDLEAPGWGEPWFPHCAFVASWLTDYCMAFLWFCCFALVFLCHTNPWGDTMLSSLLVRFRCLWTDQLIIFCMHIVVMTDVATALIRWICKMQFSFRLDKRSGVGRKKKFSLILAWRRATGLPCRLLGPSVLTPVPTGRTSFCFQLCDLVGIE